MERARDLVALHLTLAEVATHVPAVAVEDVDLAVVAAEHDQLRSERVNGVRLPVAELSGQAQAMPPASESGRRCLGFDVPDFVGVHVNKDALFRFTGRRNRRHP